MLMRQLTVVGLELAADPLTHEVEGVEILRQRVVVLLVQPRLLPEAVPPEPPGSPAKLHAKRRDGPVKVRLLPPGPAAVMVGGGGTGHLRKGGVRTKSTDTPASVTQHHA